MKNSKRGAQALGKAVTSPAAAFSLAKALAGGKDSKINNTRGVFMVISAFGLDLLALTALIPFVGWILGPLIYLLAMSIFWYWFKISHASFFSARATASKVVTTILEFIPEISAIIPSVTINVIVAIGFVRFDEAAAGGGQKEGQAQSTTAEGNDKSNVVRSKRGGHLRLVGEGVKTPARVSPTVPEEIAA